MSPFVALFCTWCVFSFANGLRLKPRSPASALAPVASPANVSSTLPYCVCGVYLSSQIVGDSLKESDENPPLSIEIEDQVTCGSLGIKDCSMKCVDELVKYLPKSSKLICGSTDREVHGEKAHLFVNVCNQGWVKTKLSTQKRICCKDSTDYKCPA